MHDFWSKCFKLAPGFDGLDGYNLNVFYFHMPDVIGCLFVIPDGHFHPRVKRFEKKKTFFLGYFRPRVYKIFNWIFEYGFLVCPWTGYGTI